MLRTIAGSAGLIGLLALVAACADALPVAPPVAQEQPTAAESECGWLRWGGGTVADWFTANPEAAALHWWDAGAQRFESIARAEQQADPMKQPQAEAVVWRSVVGTEQPLTFTAAAADQVMQLRAGLNLLPWAGGAESTLRLTEALRWLGSSVASISRWDATENICRRGWGAPDSEGADAAPRSGDLLALELREDAVWYQAWAQPQLFVVAGEVGAEAYAELRSEAVSVAGYIAATYALVGRPSLVLLTASRDQAERAFRPLLGAELPTDWWPEGACAFANGQAIGLQVGCGDPIVFAHEYVHLLQFQLVSGAAQPVDPREPQWLLEGTASYVAARYRDAAGHRRYEDSRGQFVEHASADDDSSVLAELETAAQWASADPVTAYTLAFFAAERLAALAGDDALFEFYRELGLVAKVPIRREFGKSSAPRPDKRAARRSGETAFLQLTRTGAKQRQPASGLPRSVRHDDRRFLRRIRARDGIDSGVRTTAPTPHSRRAGRSVGRARRRYADLRLSLARRGRPLRPDRCRRNV